MRFNKENSIDDKYKYLEDTQGLGLNFVDKEPARFEKLLFGEKNDDLLHDRRIVEFMNTHNLTDKYPAKDLWRWHTLLTASCARGKELFFEKHGYDLGESEATLPEFFDAVSKEHGHEIIAKIRKKMEAKEKKIKGVKKPTKNENFPFKKIKK